MKQTITMTHHTNVKPAQRCSLYTAANYTPVARDFCIRLFFDTVVVATGHVHARLTCLTSIVIMI